MKKLKLSISGMHCASCAGNIERSLRSVKGITEVRASAITHTAFVTGDDSIREEDLAKAVARAGYKLVSIT